MDELIYDRTEEDVITAISNQESSTFLKGAYNYTDLNRVGQWVAYISNLLNTYNYFNEVSTKTDWVLGDIPTYEEMSTYLQNVKNIRNAYYVMINTPELPNNIDKLNIAKANSIEKNLYDIDKLIKGMIAEFRKSGTFYSGGMEGLI